MAKNWLLKAENEQAIRAETESKYNPGMTPWWAYMEAGAAAEYAEHEKAEYWQCKAREAGWKSPEELLKMNTKQWLQDLMALWDTKAREATLKDIQERFVTGKPKRVDFKNDEDFYYSTLAHYERVIQTLGHLPEETTDAKS